jgi:hypothetical protein
MTKPIRIKPSSAQDLDSTRDWFAGMALPGLCAAGSCLSDMTVDEHAELIAKTAYLVADAMLIARKPIPRQSPPPAQAEKLSDPLARALVDFIDRQVEPRWSGTPTQLHKALENAGYRARIGEAWPQTAQSLGIALMRIAAPLKSRGVEFSRRHSGIRMITIYRDHKRAAP